ncbi:hypothetical protein C2S53_010118 [Perilla frutescens var. hirtella]|uniref:MULE transposase domain-containing protein n=1 Tax=Perilla frutescens var. hirtella TaxID=608512 RepID=A0AAD4JBA6_PERFH|nr:hypothetical protein C2S53_010118 [Perilla frutescens var. hirtella]
MELSIDNTIDDDEYVDPTTEAYNFDEYDDVSGAVDHEIPISGNSDSQLEAGQVNGNVGPQPVSFDTTYLVNRHQMSFAAFIGVNHHGHSILLGCALVTRENTTSFKWMVSNWPAAMGGVAYVGIITDQDESIKQALHESVFESKRTRSWSRAFQRPSLTKEVFYA